MKKIHIYLCILLVIVLICVLFLDIIKYIFIWACMEFYNMGEPSMSELILNIFIRVL